MRHETMAAAKVTSSDLPQSIRCDNQDIRASEAGNIVEC
jgi:hypothetical protein